MKKVNLLLTVLLLLGFCLSAGAESYTYNTEGTAAASPDAYTADLDIAGESLGVGRLSGPTDIKISPSGRLAVSDTGNGRVILTDPLFREASVLQAFDRDGEPDALAEPTGLFFTEDEHLYVCDQKNQRIVEFDEQMHYVRSIQDPTPELLPEGFAFYPSAVAVDKWGTVYCISYSSTNGYLQFSAQGEFKGFMGSPEVTLSISQKFWRALQSKEQRKRTENSIPVNFNNLAVDEEGFVYTTEINPNKEDTAAYIQSGTKSGLFMPIKKFNFNGDDVLPRLGAFAPAGDIDFEKSYPEGEKASGQLWASHPVSITLGENGTYFVADASRNKIFGYDSDGNLLYAFAGTGSQKGLFSSLTAIEWHDGCLYALDKNHSTITRFTLTEYGMMLHEAIGLSAHRRFEEAEESFRTLLSYNQNLTVAYIELGRACLEQNQYIRLSVCIPEGNTLIVRYTEELFADGTRNLSNMDAYYYGCDFQTDRLIGSGKPLRWSPLFVYHGFRYVILHGLEQPPEPADISAVFVHQMVEELSSFSCSNETINRLYACGKMATLSNLFYMPTDCPQREKLGWTNDAQASAEQMLQNFAVAPLFLKWLQDILDAMTDEGALPGIVPSHGWGYENVDGPVSSGILFELPVQVYRATGDDAAIRLAYPAMQKHLAYMAGRADPQDGLLDYGLCDWAGPFERPELAPTPKKLTHTLLLSKFFGMTAMAAGVLGHGAERKRYEELAQVWREKARAAFIGKDGRCTVEEQTGVAMLIALGAYRQLEPLKAQLRTLLEARGYHHHCGMLGMQYLFPALDICGMQEEAYRVITVPGRPSYTEWLEHDATTMWEMWHTGDSKNHHMYSCVLSWFMKTLVGLRQAEGSAGWQEAVIAPYFLSALTSCRGVYRTAGGTFMVEWNRQDGGVRLCIQVPQGVRTLLVLPDNMTVKEAAGQTAVLPAGRSVWLCHIKEDEL